MKVRFKKFISRARVNQKSTIGSSRYDFFATRCVVLEPGSTRSVETDIAFVFPTSMLEKDTQDQGYFYNLFL